MTEEQKPAESSTAPVPGPNLEFEIDGAKLVPLEKYGLGDCPVCGNKHWYIMQAPGNFIPIMPLVDAKNQMISTSGYPVVALACTRCGFTKTHIKALLDKFLEDDSNGKDQHS